MTAMLMIDANADPDAKDIYGILCEGCLNAKTGRPYRRSGMVQQHALNAVAKHNREHHPEVTINLTSAAIFLQSAPEHLPLMKALLGRDPSGDELTAWAEAPTPVILHVPPF